MRRCPACQSPNPEDALHCSHCGAALPPLARQPWLTAADFWDAQAFGRVLIGLLPLLAFRLTFGDLLTVGGERQEWHFLLFHGLHGLILGAGLAWAWRERRPSGWALWLGAGLLGGLVAEALEVWYTYRGLMGLFSLWAWDWFGLPATNTLIYRFLQVLRLAGPALALGGAYVWREPRLSRRLLAALLAGLALALRSGVRGVFLHWNGLFQPDFWVFFGLYAASALALAWGLGPRPGASESSAGA